MPVNSYSVGRDLSFVLNGPNGRIVLNGVTDYNTKPTFTHLSHKGLDGERTNAHVPDGWEITMRLDRQDPIVDTFFAQLEAAYFAGQNLQNGSISETIQEADGSVSIFQYTKVSLRYDDAGSWKGDSLIPISLTALASRRNKIG